MTQKRKSDVARRVSRSASAEPAPTQASAHKCGIQRHLHLLRRAPPAGANRAANVVDLTLEEEMDAAQRVAEALCAPATLA